MFDAAGLSSAQTVLVHAAAGGVGHLAVQLAKWKGARVIGTASADNAAFLRGRGEILERSWQVLREGGTLVSIVSQVPEQAARRRGASVFVQPNAEQLGQIARLIDSGRLAPTVSEVLPLAEARRAQQLSQRGHTRGKIVLRVVAQAAR